jgi:excisionase family DNA binding protein
VNLTISLTDEQVNEIAARAAELVADHQPAGSPWLDTKDAADHIAATPGRIHDLVQLGHLTPRRDGRRLLFRREDLDAYLEASA